MTDNRKPYLRPLGITHPGKTRLLCCSNSFRLPRAPRSVHVSLAGVCLWHVAFRRRAATETEHPVQRLLRQWFVQVPRAAERLVVGLASRRGALAGCARGLRRHALR